MGSIVGKISKHRLNMVINIMMTIVKIVMISIMVIVAMVTTTTKMLMTIKINHEVMHLFHL